jgi:hypothetical protein
MGPEFGGTLVFSVMGCVSLTMSLFLHLRSRALVRLPRNCAEVHDRTFSIFDPSPEQRGLRHSYLGLLLIVALIGPWAVVYVVLTILAMGLVLGLATFIFCLSLMMFDEAFEVYKNTGMLVRAIGSRAGFGVGDLAVLSVLKRILPKLRTYYVLLSASFFASAVALPYVVPAAIIALAQFTSAVINFSAPASVLAAYVLVLPFAAAEVIVYVIVRKAKSRIFGSHSAQVQEETPSQECFACTISKHGG